MAQAARKIDYEENLRTWISDTCDQLFGGSVRAMAIKLEMDDDSSLKRLYRTINGETKRIDPDIVDAMVSHLGVSAPNWAYPKQPAPVEVNGELAVFYPMNGGQYVADREEMKILAGKHAEELMVYVHMGEAMFPNIPRLSRVKYLPTDGEFLAPGVYVIRAGLAKPFVANMEHVPPNKYRVFYSNPSYQGFTVIRSGDRWLNEDGEDMGFEIVGIAMSWPQTHSIPVNVVSPQQSYPQQFASG